MNFTWCDEAVSEASTEEKLMQEFLFEERERRVLLFFRLLYCPKSEKQLGRFQQLRVFTNDQYNFRVIWNTRNSKSWFSLKDRVKLQLHDAIYRLLLYSNSLIHILSLPNSHNNVASIQKNRADKSHRVIVALHLCQYVFGHLVIELVARAVPARLIIRKMERQMRDKWNFLHRSHLRSRGTVS